MQCRNTTSSWGWVSLLLHWITAVLIYGLFILGVWMVDLSYYDDWYRTAPDIHRSLGILLLIATIPRILWRRSHAAPKPLPNHKPWEHKAASIAHLLMVLFIVTVIVSGYFISTADGRSIQVFNWFEIPATLHGIQNQEDIAGEIHFILAVLLVALSAVHAAAAIKHHFIDKDSTFRRMLGK